MNYKKFFSLLFIFSAVLCITSVIKAQDATSSDSLISITYPTSDSSWSVGKSNYIRWTVDSTIKKVNVTLTNTDTGDETTLRSNVSASRGYYLWNISKTLEAGTYTITVTDAADDTNIATSDPFTLTVKVTSIKITSPSSKVSLSSTLQLTETVSPDNASDSAVIWSAKNGTGKATIDTTGLLTPTKVGTVTVTATANDGSKVKSTKTITVTKATTTVTTTTPVTTTPIATTPVTTNPIAPNTINTYCAYQYSDWTACTPAGTQTRSVLQMPAANCFNVPLVTTQACQYNLNGPKICTESDWLPTIYPDKCPFPSGNTQTRTWNKISNCINGVQHMATESVVCWVPTVAKSTTQVCPTPANFFYCGGYQAYTVTTCIPGVSTLGASGNCASYVFDPSLISAKDLLPTVTLTIKDIQGQIPPMQSDGSVKGTVGMQYILNYKAPYAAKCSLSSSPTDANFSISSDSVIASQLFVSPTVTTTYTVNCSSVRGTDSKSLTINFSSAIASDGSGTTPSPQFAVSNPHIKITSVINNGAGVGSLTRGSTYTITWEDHTTLGTRSANSPSDAVYVYNYNDFIELNYYDANFQKVGGTTIGTKYCGGTCSYDITVGTGVYGDWESHPFYSFGISASSSEVMSVVGGINQQTGMTGSGVVKAGIVSTTNLFRVTEPTCTPNWSCTWSVCNGVNQTSTCTDLNNCPANVQYPNPSGSRVCSISAAPQCTTTKDCQDKYKNCYYSCSNNSCVTTNTLIALKPYPDCTTAIVSSTQQAASTSNKSNDAQPSVTLSSPAGGEVWKKGETHVINWKATNMGTVSIYLYSTHGNATINPAIDPATGTYSWVIPSTLNTLNGNDFSVSVCGCPKGNTMGCTPTCGKSVAFSLLDNNCKPNWQCGNGGCVNGMTSPMNCLDINYCGVTTDKPVPSPCGPPNIIVTSPVGGETWTAGQTYNIKWTSTGVNKAMIIANVNGLNYGTAVSISGSSIQGIPASTGTYSWTIPSTFAPGPYKIEIDDTDNLNPITGGGSIPAKGQSQNNFTIISPN